jgi:hypothetical protein
LSEYNHLPGNADAANAILAAIGESGCPCIIFYPDWSMHIALPQMAQHFAARQPGK